MTQATLSIFEQQTEPAGTGEPFDRLPERMTVEGLPHPDEDPDLQYYHPGKQWTLLTGTEETGVKKRRITIIEYDPDSVEGVKLYEERKGFHGPVEVIEPEDRDHDGTVTVGVEETGGVGAVSAVGLRRHSSHYSVGGPVNEDSYLEYYEHHTDGEMA